MDQQPGQDVVDLLLDQHHQIETLLQQIRTGQGRKDELFTDLVRLLAIHEAAEEEVVHPIAKRAENGDGEGMVEARLEEESEAKHALAELYKLGVESPEFDVKFAEFAAAVADHAEREEAEEFTLLRKQLTTTQLERMATSVRAAEAVAPTRPHPSAGESAVANLLAGPPLAVFDRVRDAVRDMRRKSGHDS
ncbi:hemerythrin domain-containing protein [Nocardia huaxiensis]|uniref:hemerythrin domain-containing protein n=1 Tax=Nocardia huaxiensis TaxID=2755382 RepID=UPI001E2DC149|nr:hemerythrin domain-containing protein [Nocardia huaxiensis]UFT00344.1 hemerythrin domain-containing protein [Nocardia huaxiensis]